MILINIVFKIVENMSVRNILYLFCFQSNHKHRVVIRADPGSIHEFLNDHPQVFEFHMLYGKKYGEDQFVNVYLVSGTDAAVFVSHLKDYISDDTYN